MCALSGETKKAVNHLMLDRPKYKEIRSEIVELQQPYEEDRRKVIGKFLFDEQKEVLQKLWSRDLKIISVLRTIRRHQGKGSAVAKAILPSSI